MFREALIHDLDSGDFSDMVAQTVTYGLFSATTTGEKITGLSNLSNLIPNTNPFLKIYLMSSPLFQLQNKM